MQIIEAMINLLFLLMATIVSRILLLKDIIIVFCMVHIYQISIPASNTNNITININIKWNQTRIDRRIKMQKANLKILDSGETSELWVEFACLNIKIEHCITILASN